MPFPPLPTALISNSCTYYWWKMVPKPCHIFSLWRTLLLFFADFDIQSSTEGSHFRERRSTPKSGNTKLALLIPQWPGAFQLIKVSVYWFGAWWLSRVGARRVVDEAGEVDDKIRACCVGPGKDLWCHNRAEKPFKWLVPEGDMIWCIILKDHPGCFVYLMFVYLRIRRRQKRSWHLRLGE